MIVYLVTNKLNGKRYVGLTKHTLELRWSQHAQAARLQGCPRMLLPKAIKKYGEENFERIVLEKCHSEEHLREREKFYIQELKTHSGSPGHHGYNMTAGGDGVIGYVSSPEMRKAASERMKGEKNWNYRKAWGRTGPLTEEAKQKISAAKIGVAVHTDDSKRRIGEATSIRKSKCVTAYNKHTLEPIASFLSIKDAANHFGLTHSAISKRLRNPKLQPGEYVWKYSKSYSARI